MIDGGFFCAGIMLSNDSHSVLPFVAQSHFNCEALLAVVDNPHLGAFTRPAIVCDLT